MYEQQAIPNVLDVLKNLRLQLSRKKITTEDYEKRMDEIFRIANESEAVEQRFK